MGFDFGNAIFGISNGCFVGFVLAIICFLVSVSCCAIYDTKNNTDKFFKWERHMEFFWTWMKVAGVMTIIFWTIYIIYLLTHGT